MSLFTVAVMLLVTEAYSYLAQNTAQTQREKTTQRSEERKERNLCALRSSALQIGLAYRSSRIIRARIVQEITSANHVAGASSRRVLCVSVVPITKLSQRGDADNTETLRNAASLRSATTKEVLGKGFALEIPNCELRKWKAKARTEFTFFRP